MINKRIINVLVLMCVLFFTLIAYLTYFEITQKEKVSQNPYDQRQLAYENDIVRGSIYDRNGTLLAKTEDKQRIYPYKKLYSHVIGYHSKVYGKSMLEANYNSQLLAQDGLSQTFSLGGNKTGNDLTLTIDHNLQQLASNQMGSKNGAVVALDPRTGEILAMVSKPDFDPNNDALVKEWGTLIEEEDSPLLPRALSGMYAPGSTFKMITAAAAIEAGLENDTYDDQGSVKIGGKTFENQRGKKYGNIDLTRAFAVSSNVAFCTLGEKLGGPRLMEIAGRFGFNQTTSVDVATAISRFPTAVKDSAQAAALAMGQGETLVTPMQIAMITSAIANDGVIMRPYLVKNVKTAGGLTLSDGKQSVLYRPLSAEVARSVRGMMIETVKTGTGAIAAIPGVTVAAKTGTAENELTTKQKNKEHTWFVAFAPAENPTIAVAVMTEYSGGTGAENCGPIARAILRQYLEK